MSASSFLHAAHAGWRRGPWALAPGLLAIVCVGCGPTTSTVKGHVTVDGKPLVMTRDARGTVVFHPAGGQGAMATGLLDRTGNFQLGTGASSNIVPGRYQVAISVVELVPAEEGGEPRGKRVTPAKYSSAIDSGLQAEVTLGDNDFSFDISSADEAFVDESPSSTDEGKSPVKPQAATEVDASTPVTPEK